jgi:cytochrome c peroxidase
MVGCALGMGVFAFTLKMAVTLTVSSYPEHTIKPLLPDAQPVDWVADPSPVTARPHRWEALPLRAPYPPNDPPTLAKTTLGERLFHDPRLSRDGSLSCASCHATRAKAGADGDAVATGIEGQKGDRNTPTVWNAAFQARLFWDGRATSLEDQALGPLLNPIEMGMRSVEDAAGRLRADASYRADFEQAFGEDAAIDGTTIARALAAYERTLITPHTRYDRFVRGDVHALTGREKRGMWLFESAGCVQCHAGPNFSGASLVGLRRPFAPLRVGGTEADRVHGLTTDRGRNGLWRIPSLRNVALTGPYLHNGSVTDLAEVVRIMASSQLGLSLTGAAPAPAPPWLPDVARFGAPRPRGLSDDDIDAIVAFLGSLSDPDLDRSVQTHAEADIPQAETRAQ